MNALARTIKRDRSGCYAVPNRDSPNALNRLTARIAGGILDGRDQLDRPAPGDLGGDRQGKACVVAGSRDVRDALEGLQFADRCQGDLLHRQVVRPLDIDRDGAACAYLSPIGRGSYSYLRRDGIGHCQREAVDGLIGGGIGRGTADYDSCVRDGPRRHIEGK